ncbi:benzoate/H(+) symporter BenE family transporter [Candidatus Entotheonella palauensis]|uniref:benzoate/H(+) symporter BenE family transporter n=1 Tax=Candidatus Entotheonella palauensis TaxID=93172 RepID=UPI000B7D7656|nr:benzoate/H(+) symporter BenE family transporter [Candidatus Entotheonella palauensis]
MNRHVKQSLEPAASIPPRPNMIANISRHHIANGVTAFLYAITGPLAILLTVATGGGLTTAQISSWIFASYGLGGLLSIGASLVFRQPLALVWTIPGALLLPPAFGHLSFSEILGAYWLTGVLILMLGAMGWVTRLMRCIPLPIVMGMVGGVFVPFGLKIVSAFDSLPWAAGVTIGVFVIISRIAALARYLPPILAAMIPGVLVLMWTGQFHVQAPLAFAMASPLLQWPVFSWQAAIELVVPLTITVVAIQNAQGFAILQATGMHPPTGRLTVICGVSTCVFAIFGSVPNCLAGPANAILVSSGKRETAYISGIIFGVLLACFGVWSPATTGIALALPIGFIGLVGGIALVPVLHGVLHAAFSGPWEP